LSVPGASSSVVGHPIEEFLGAELFGPEGALRRALLSGERREGWGAALSVGGRSARFVSLSAAPLGGVSSPLCDPRVAYLLIIRSSEDASQSDGPPIRAFSGMIARSREMLQIFELVQNLSDSEATVLIAGESGTGKELVARALHDHSPNRKGPFVALNCGAIPAELVESELFGHVRGAFTGAIRDREGRFELARDGTLFLDEVGDLPGSLQVKLLRVLQERTFERVGESQTRRTSARIIAASNRDLRSEVAAGRFREDLYYRLRVVPIRIPPLRDRVEDIEPLAHHFLSLASARGRRSLFLAPDATRALLGYAWPGNARELANAIEYAVATCKGQTIHAGDFPQDVALAKRTTPAATPDPLVDPEAIRIRRVLEANRWNRARAAQELGMSRTTLWRKMRELRLDA
jgi:DNA-binding NtrC family response regulator